MNTKASNQVEHANVLESIPADNLIYKLSQTEAGEGGWLKYHTNLSDQKSQEIMKILGPGSHMLGKYKMDLGKMSIIELNIITKKYTLSPFLEILYVCIWTEDQEDDDYYPSQTARFFNVHDMAEFISQLQEKCAHSTLNPHEKMCPECGRVLTNL